MAENHTFNFKTFDQFEKFLEEEGKNMPNWSDKKCEQYSKYLVELCDKDPVFKEKMDKFTKKVNEQVLKRSQRVTIGDKKQNEESAALVHARKRLKEIQEIRNPDQKTETKTAKPRIVLDGDSKQNKAVLEALKLKKRRTI